MSSLMIGALLDARNAGAYRDQAPYQLRTSIDTFLVKANLTAGGALRNTYYTWAVPAENREMRLRDETSGWAMGFVLAIANEMTL